MFKRANHHLKGCRQWVLADPTLPLADQFFQTLCVLGGVLCLCIVFPLNAFQDLSPWVSRGAFAFGSLCLLLTKVARRRSS